MNLDVNARYQDSHEWSRKEAGLIVVGITDHAQENLSDVVYIELPEVGASLKKGEIFGTIESVKAASDLYMPMNGEIVEINSELEDEPEIINDDPFGKGWMMKIKPDNPADWDNLLSGAEYQKAVGAE